MQSEEANNLRISARSHRVLSLRLLRMSTCRFTRVGPQQWMMHAVVALLVFCS